MVASDMPARYGSHLMEHHSYIYTMISSVRDIHRENIPVKNQQRTWEIIRINSGKKSDSLLEDIFSGNIAELEGRKTNSWKEAIRYGS